MNTEPMVGLMRARDFKRAVDGMHAAKAFLPWLRIAGDVRFDAPDVRVSGGGPSSGGLPATLVAHMTITSLIHELQAWDELIDAAEDMHGQYLLDSLGIEMETALHRWPMEDKPRTIQHLRCGDCGRLTVRYDPPTGAGEDTTATCTSAGCAYKLRGDELALRVELLRREKENRND